MDSSLSLGCILGFRRLFFRCILLHLLWFLHHWLRSRRVYYLFEIRILLYQVVCQNLQTLLKVVQMPCHVIVHMIPDSFSLNLHFTTIRLITAVYNTVHAGLQVLLHLASLKIPFETLLWTFHDEFWTVPHVVFLHILVDKHGLTKLTSI